MSYRPILKVRVCFCKCDKCTKLIPSLGEEVRHGFRVALAKLTTGRFRWRSGPRPCSPGTEFSSVVHATKESDHLADGRFEGHFAGGDRRETFLQIKAQHGAGKTDGVHASAVGLLGAVLDDVGDQLELLLHELPVSLECRARALPFEFKARRFCSPERGYTPARSRPGRR